MYSGITSGRELDGELLYTKILEVNLLAFAYRLFHRDFSPLDGAFLYIYILFWGVRGNPCETVCKNTAKLTLHTDCRPI